MHPDTHKREAMPNPKWVTVAIWKLATPDSYRSVSKHFGAGESTIVVVVA